MRRWTIQEFSQGTRRLTAARAVSVSIAVILAVAIGAGTAFFNVMSGLWFKEPSVASTAGLVSFVTRGGAASEPVLDPDVVTRLAGEGLPSLRLTFGNGVDALPIEFESGVRVLRTEVVAGSYFTAVGARPLVGRMLNSADDLPAGTPSAVISEGPWQALGADLNLVGTRLSAAGQAYVIVGVIARPFEGLGQFGTGVWVSSSPAWRPTRLRGVLRDGAVLSQANAELQSRHVGVTLEAVPGLRAPLPPAGYLLFLVGILIASLVFVLAGSSVGLLLLARAIETRGDRAIRVALGARSSDIYRLFLVEMLLLSASAVLIGMPLASAVASVAMQYLGDAMRLTSLAIDARPDWPVFIYVGASVTILGFFVLRAVMTNESSNGETLAFSSAGIGGTTAQVSLTGVRLIAVQVASATTLVTVALLLAKGAEAPHARDSWHRTQSVSVAWTAEQQRQESPQRRLQLLDIVSRSAGVASAALVTKLPGSPGKTSRFHGDGPVDSILGRMEGVSANAFDVLGISLKAGRALTAAEVATMAPVAVISESTAAALWRAQSPLGRRFEVNRSPHGRVSFLVVGVVPDAARLSDSRHARDVFVPLGYTDEASVALVVRSLTDPGKSVVHVRDVIAKEGLASSFFPPRPLAVELDSSLAAAKLLSRTFGMLSLAGVPIAVAGIYGVSSAVVRRRRREVAIMRALGATTGQVWRTVSHEGIKALAIGVGAGLGFTVLTVLLIRGRTGFLQRLDWEVVLLAGVSVILVGLASSAAPCIQFLRGGIQGELRS